MLEGCCVAVARGQERSRAPEATGEVAVPVAGYAWCHRALATSVRLSSLMVSEPVSFAIYKKKLLFLPCWNYWIKSYFYKFVMNWIMTILRIKFLEKKQYMLAFRFGMF